MRSTRAKGISSISTSSMQEDSFLARSTTTGCPPMSGTICRSVSVWSSPIASRSAISNRWTALRATCRSPRSTFWAGRPASGAGDDSRSARSATWATRWEATALFAFSSEARVGLTGNVGGVSLPRRRERLGEVLRRQPWRPALRGRRRGALSDAGWADPLRRRISAEPDSRPARQRRASEPAGGASISASARRSESLLRVSGSAAASDLPRSPQIRLVPPSASAELAPASELQPVSPRAQHPRSSSRPPGRRPHSRASVTSGESTWSVSCFGIG